MLGRWHLPSMLFSVVSACVCGEANLTRHGEVFVLNDGGEVDLDLGNYERWVWISSLDMWVMLTI